MAIPQPADRCIEPKKEWIILQPTAMILFWNYALSTDILFRQMIKSMQNFEVIYIDYWGQIAVKGFGNGEKDWRKYE